MIKAIFIYVYLFALVVSISILIISAILEYLIWRLKNRYVRVNSKSIISDIKHSVSNSNCDNNAMRYKRKERRERRKKLVGLIRRVFKK